MGLPVVVQNLKCWVPPFGTTSERNLNSLFIMNSAGEEDEDSSRSRWTMEKIAEKKAA